jgi:hypothetical protein
MARRACSSARLAFFGDSFIHGDEVSDDDAALSQLQQLVDGEIINGGVSGYGTDQALLRLEHAADVLDCTWLFLGIATCDETRNINILRLHHSSKSAIPYMKPRFVESGDTLHLVHPPLNLHRSMREHYLDANTQEFLAKYDAFYPPRGSINSSIAGIFGRRGEYVPKTGARQELGRRLTLSIVKRFWHLVHRRGCRGTLVLIPNSTQLETRSDLDFYRAAFSDTRYEFCDLAHVFHTRGHQRFAYEDLWCANGHFAPLASRWVAEALAEYIATARPSPGTFHGQRRGA